MKIYTFLRIRNIEFGHLYLRSIDVIKRHDPVALHIEAEYEQARASVELCDHLMVKSRKIPMTAKQRKAQKVLLDSASMLIKKIRLISNEPGVELPEGFSELLELFDTHLSKIRRRNFYEQTRVIQGFFDEVEKVAINPALLEELHLSMQYAKLKQDFDSLNSIFDMRQFAKAKKEKAQALNSRRKLNNLLRRLFLEIESKARMFPEMDYSPLINELNGEIATIGNRNSTNSAPIAANVEETQHVA